jgi:chemotaxis response regulator CheB/chemotaxis methyl-accepting protein methylase
MDWTEEDRRIVTRLAVEISGANNLQSLGLDFLVRNVDKRIREQGLATLQDYLQLVASDESEYEMLVSSLTIHTTSWFREEPHFRLLTDLATKFQRTSPNGVFRIWSAACSTGEEPYSIAIRLMQFKEKNPTFQFEVWASDIDPNCVRTARNGVYPEKSLDALSDEDHKYFLLGSKETAGLVAVAPELRAFVKFFEHDILEEERTAGPNQFDAIFCRNVLIYFELNTQEKILKRLSVHLRSQGTLVLGHSDTLPQLQGYRRLDGSSLVRVEESSSVSLGSSTRRSRVLVIDDSQTLRKVLKSIFSEKFDVIEAESAEEAERRTKNDVFDLITLDLNLPGEHGVSWLHRFRRNDTKTPIVIVSESSSQDAEKVFGALEGGAQDYIVKSLLMKDPQIVRDLAISLTQNKIDSRNRVQLASFKSRKNFKPAVILIGASTGGPEALVHLLSSFPRQAPPIVIVQHIGPEFAFPFAKRLAEKSGLILGDPRTGSVIESGHLYMALGDYHLLLRAQGSSAVSIETQSHDKVHGHRPSVDVLFNSAARLGVDTIALLLTGMGKDGALGIKTLYEEGNSYTLAQDATSSVVFGMPKAAIETGAVCAIGDIPALRTKLEERIAS